MKLSNYIYLMLFIALLYSCNSKRQKAEAIMPPIIEHPYLGQKPPGLIPEIFAPGIVSTNDLEIEPVFAPDLKTFYFVRQKRSSAPMSYMIKYRDGTWEASESERSTGEVFISADGQTMYLGNKYKERTDAGWSTEKSLGPLFEKIPIMRLTVSVSGTYYFDEREATGNLRYARLVNGKYDAPQSLHEGINTGKYTAHPFIAPDESYLIWDSERAGGYGGSDLYISFRQEDGSWGAAINMGPEINSVADDTYGSVTMDGKFFFFNRLNLGVNIDDSQANIYWVDAHIIEKLRQSK